MNVYTYWKWDEYLTPDQCKMILTERAELPESQAEIEDGVIEDIRKTNIVWTKINHWLNGALFNLGRIANENANWNFTITTPEKMQLARYSDNGFYKDHIDAGVYPYPSSIIRKISVVALLNDPSEWEGGEFVFNSKDIVTLKMGDVIAFPSTTLHRVNPVTNGERYSATCWISGPK
jgi:predicted 2-oxoglutarate/Fe(II)-dependent dioxygenase YbiX